ncbi:hypothetical protein AAC387_Pa05g2765 [Persea americana]
MGVEESHDAFQAKAQRITVTFLQMSLHRYPSKQRCHVRKISLLHCGFQGLLYLLVFLSMVRPMAFRTSEN